MSGCLKAHLGEAASWKRLELTCLACRGLLLDCIAQCLEAVLPDATLLFGLVFALTLGRCHRVTRRQCSAFERGILVRGGLVLGVGAFGSSER